VGEIAVPNVRHERGPKVAQRPLQRPLDERLGFFNKEALDLRRSIELVPAQVRILT
jgi:hypothetical protein